MDDGLEDEIARFAKESNETTRKFFAKLRETGLTTSNSENFDPELLEIARKVGDLSRFAVELPKRLIESEIKEKQPAEVATQEITEKPVLRTINKTKDRTLLLVILILGGTLALFTYTLFHYQGIVDKFKNKNSNIAFKLQDCRVWRKSDQNDSAACRTDKEKLKKAIKTLEDELRKNP